MEPFFCLVWGYSMSARAFPPKQSSFLLAIRGEKLHLHLGGGEVAGPLSAGLVPRWEGSEIPQQLRAGSEGSRRGGEAQHLAGAWRDASCRETANPLSTDLLLLLLGKPELRRRRRRRRCGADQAASCSVHISFKERV